MCQTKAVTGLEFSRNIVLFIWIFRPPLVLKQASSAEKKICLSCQKSECLSAFSQWTNHEDGVIC